MGAEISLADLRARGLRRHQAEFIRAVLAEAAPSRHSLVAPPGTGVGGTLAALAAEAIRLDSARRILVLVLARPRLILEQLRHQLQNAGVELPCEVFDGPALRAAMAEADPSSAWREAGIALVSLDLACRPQAAEALLAGRWDLLIVWADQLSGRARDFLHRFVADVAPRRVVVATATNEAARRFSLKDAISNEWSDVRDWDGRPILVHPEDRVVRFERAPEERAFLDYLSAFLNAELQGRVAGLQRTLLLRMAASSLMAIEGPLRTTRNMLVHLATAAPASIEANEDGDQPTDPGQLRWREQPEALVGLTRALHMLDELGGDAKRDALVKEVLRLRSEQHRTVAVCTAFLATATYVATCLNESGVSTCVLTGALMDDERHRRSEDLSRTGGVLVTTDAGLTGMLRGVTAVIHYDSASSDLALARRLAVIDRSTSGRAPVSVALQEVVTISPQQ